MLLDTLALKAVERSGKTLSEIGSHDVFDLLIDLKEKGLLNFDYELITTGGQKKFNCPEHTLKHMVREMCRGILGMTVVNDDMVREVTMRLKYVEDNAVVPAETEEFQHIDGEDHEPTMFITLSMPTSVAFDAGAPYKVMGMTWAAGDNGVSKQLDPTNYVKYDTGPIFGTMWSASFSPGATSSIFNSISLMALDYAAYGHWKFVHIQHYTNYSLLDLRVGAGLNGGNFVTVESQEAATVVTNFAPRGADFGSLHWEIEDVMFGHIGLANGLTISWSKGGGDWD